MEKQNSRTLGTVLNAVFTQSYTATQAGTGIVEKFTQEAAEPVSGGGG